MARLARVGWLRASSRHLEHLFDDGRLLLGFHLASVLIVASYSLWSGLCIATFLRPLLTFVHGFDRATSDTELLCETDWEVSIAAGHIYLL